MSHPHAMPWFASLAIACSSTTAMPDGSVTDDARATFDARARADSGDELDSGRPSDAAARTDSGPMIDSGPSSRRVIWASDFSTETGMSEAAETDGNRWDIYSDPANGFEVVPGGPLGFPTANVLAVTAREERGGYARLAVTGLGVPENGESRYWRWYYRNEIGSTADDGTHPIESGGGIDWSCNVEVQSDTTWRPELRSNGDSMDADRARWTGPILDTGVVYRFELQIEKLSDAEYRAHLRVFDAAGALILDDDDFNNEDSGLGPSMRMTLADSPTLHFDAVGGTNLDELRAGINGLADMGYGALLFAYQGGFAVCADDWCGPYVEGEGR